jgi:hypothetical protein
MHRGPLIENCEAMCFVPLQMSCDVAHHNLVPILNRVTVVNWPTSNSTPADIEPVHNAEVDDDLTGYRKQRPTCSLVITLTSSSPFLNN